MFAACAVGLVRLVFDVGGAPFVLHDCSVLEELTAMVVHLSSLMFRHDAGFWLLLSNLLYFAARMLA